MKVLCPTSNSVSEPVHLNRTRHFGAVIMNLFQTGITQSCGNRQAPKGQATRTCFPLLHFLGLGPLTQRQRALYSKLCSPAEVVIGGGS